MGIAIILLLLVLLFVFVFRFVSINKSSASNNSHVTVTPSVSQSGLGEFKASNGDVLGINDGSYAPFITRFNGSLKQQAADQLKQGHTDKAISLWHQALKIRSNDAEALIYLEDQNIRFTGLSYVTLVVGVDLINPADLSDLQGIYVAQHAFNQKLHGLQLRILIANSGIDTVNVPRIAQRIVALAHQDKTVVGVISWLTSTENLRALPILAAAHIPMISPTASSDALTGSSPYFFRVVPPNKVQGTVAAIFAEQALHAKTAVVFLDTQDTYSQNLAQDFENQFKKDGNTLLKEENFTTDQTKNIGDLIQDALKQGPDLLYFTSRDTPDSVNFQDALPMTGPFAHLPVVAGDTGYVVHSAGLGRWYFTPFAFADEWKIVMGSNQAQPFFQEYSDDMDPDHLQKPGFYEFTRPLDVAILAYDVTSVFLDALQLAITSNKIALTQDGLTQLTPELMTTALDQISGAQAWQGVSGLINFGSNHDPINKVVVVLSASLPGFTQMSGWQGCFTQTICKI